MRSRSELTAPEIIRGWLVDADPSTGIDFADEQGGWTHHTYRDVAGISLAIAEMMRARGVREGDGVCVVMPTDITCAAAFYAVWACGGVFTPITPPTFGDLDEYIDHVAAILVQAQPRVVLTIPGLADVVQSAARRVGGAGEPLAIDPERLPPTPATFEFGEPGECALLQFTSGSTGSPRGVRVSWENLATNTAMITDLLRWRPGEAMSSWLPLYHDMGLVGGFLTTVTNQENLYVMRPDQFIRDPARWLRSMTIAQHTPSPSFALGYVAHRVSPDSIADLDLSGWRTLAVGSEPVEISDLTAFTDLVGPLGFDVEAFTLAYGLAESTLMVSSSRRDRPISMVRPVASTMQFATPVAIAETRELVAGKEYPGTGWLAGLGVSTADSTVGVVDDDGQPLPDGTLGEVVVSGGSIALGYSEDREPAEGSTRIVGGRLFTGDAGFVWDDEVFVLGRMGASLKVRGRSVFMEDIESRVSVECGITKGKLAAVAITDAGSAGIALFAEVAPGDWITRARTMLRAELGPAQTVMVITGPRGLIRRTSSGKPRRRHMWQLFGDGVLTGAQAHEADGTASASVAGRRPALTAERVGDLLDHALAEVTVPDDCAVVFEGSLAEGFGNEGSDVDFLVIVGGDEEMPTLPSVLFADGRRVEIRTRSLTQLRSQLDAVAEAEAEDGIGDLSEDVLNRCQRFLRSTPVRESAVFDLGELRSVITYDDFADVVARWWDRRAVAAIRYANAMRILGQTEDAVDWAADGLLQAAKAWCARHGETYVETKWLPHQLDRLQESAEDAALVDRYRIVSDDLRSLGSPSAQVPDHWWDAVETTLGELTGTGPTEDRAAGTSPDSIVLARVPGVTTWKIGGRIHVIRSGRDVFTLSDAGGAQWRQVVFRQSVVNVVARNPGIGDALAEFIRLGLVGLDVRGEGPIAPAMAMCPVIEPYTPTPYTGRPVLGLTGATRPADDGPIAALCPLPADRFASAGLDLTWANVVAENAREDLAGAVKSGQGAVADVAAHRLVAMSTRMMLAAFGVHPLPPDTAPVATLRRVVPELVADEDFLSVFDAASAVRFSSSDDPYHAFDAVDRLLERAREVVIDNAFPSSFDSRQQWRRTLEISYDWVRLGNHLGVRLPLAEAEDLLNSGGDQPHTPTPQRGGH